MPTTRRPDRPGAVLGPLLSAVLTVGVLLLAGPSPVLAATTGPPPGPGAAATEGSRITFGIGPATDGALDRRSGFTLLAPRGGLLRDEVAVVNLGERPITLDLYAADAVNGTDGTLAIQPGAAQPVGAATWVTLRTPTGEGYVVVPGRDAAGRPGRVVVPFTVRIPADAEVGDHLAGIVASTVAAGQAPGRRGTDVELEQRLALRLGVRVAGPLAPALVVEDLRASFAGSLNPIGAGSAMVTYTVRNTGNVRLGGAQDVRVDGPFGSRVTSVPLDDVPLLLPGGSATVTVPVEGVPPLGVLTATVTVVPLVAAGDANPNAGTATGSATFLAVPWLLVAVLLALLALLGWWWRRRRAGARAGGAVVDVRPDPQLLTR